MTLNYQHILNILNSLMRFSTFNKINILDVGCGNGQLIKIMQKKFSTSKIYGFDIQDFYAQKNNFYKETCSYLKEKIPSIDWSARISLFSSNQKWDYPDNFFSFIVSNQVLEHTQNLDFIFAEISRTLAYNGYSIHIFPLANCMWEGHLNMAFPHYFQIDNREKYIKFLAGSLACLGYGEYYKKSKFSLSRYAIQRADFIEFYTNYVNKKYIYKLSKKHNLRASFKKTKDLFILKNKMFKIFPSFLLKYISSVTLVLQKTDNYREYMQSQQGHQLTI